MASRRAFLVGSVVPTIAVLGGCSEFQSTIEEETGAGGDFSVVSSDAESTDFGNVNVAARVENTYSDSRSGTLVAQAELERGDTFTAERSVDVPSEQTRDYTVGIDIPISDSLTGFSYRHDAWIR